MSTQDDSQYSAQIQRLQQTLAGLEEQRNLLATRMAQSAITGSTQPREQPPVYKLWRAEYQGAINHVALFLETEDNGDGVKYHVTGTILNGMIYEKKKEDDPAKSAAYVPDSKVLLGVILREHVSRLELVCEDNPPPAKQVRLNGSRLDTSKPLRRCGEWIDEVIAQLRRLSILKDPDTVTDPSEETSQLQHTIKESRDTLQQHVESLSRYNETKDVATGLVGMIAENRQERIVDTMKSFDVDAKD